MQRIPTFKSRDTFHDKKGFLHSQAILIIYVIILVDGWVGLARVFQVRFKTVNEFFTFRGDFEKKFNNGNR